MRNWIVAAASVAILAGAVQAQRGAERLSRECRQQIIELCGQERGKLRECLRDKASALPENCSAEIRARVQARMGDGETNAPAQDGQRLAALGGVELSYGDNPLQRLDFYKAKTDKIRAPLIVFVHGGGWKRGDKRNATGSDKITHYTGRGYHFASINYRLVPAASVEQQAADVAAALAHLSKNAVKMGIDPSRIVLMGHSAGAHLSALVGSDPKYLRAAGHDLGLLAGVVPIDGAAYDVPAQMADGAKIMQDTYADAFGTDPARQKALSPYWHADGPNAKAFLILHVERADGKRQSEALAKALRKGGADVQLEAFSGKGMRGHAEINRKLGDPDYPATPVVDAWLEQLFEK